jgi:DNA-binding response OmpR family regulator
VAVVWQRLVGWFADYRWDFVGGWGTIPRVNPVEPTTDILIVDDDASLVEVLQMALEDAGFRVRVAHDGLAGWSAFQQTEPHLVLLDLLMPELDGMELCKRIRGRSAVPIVMLTSRDHEMDKVLGLEGGADDYVSKPFSTRELIARIRAALRRVSLDRGEGPHEEVRSHTRVWMDRGRREFRLDGQAIDLTATEFEVLWTFMGKPDRVLSRNELVDSVYGADIVVTDRTIDTYIKRIRMKIHQLDAQFDPIETVRAVGYRFRRG